MLERHLISGFSISSSSDFSCRTPPMSGFAYASIDSVASLLMEQVLLRSHVQSALYKAQTVKVKSVSEICFGLLQWEPTLLYLKRPRGLTAA